VIVEGVVEVETDKKIDEKVISFAVINENWKA
jgi:hypothetical protein